MRSESDKSADHEICSSDHCRFHCVRFASVRSVSTALSGESGAAIWRRTDRDRKGFDPTFCKTSACCSAKVSAVSAAKAQVLTCVTGAFSLAFSQMHHCDQSRREIVSASQSRRLFHRKRESLHSWPAVELCVFDCICITVRERTK